MIELCGLTEEELKAYLQEIGEPAFRATQILDWVYRKGALSFAEMTNLSKELRTKLSECFLFPTLRLITVREAEETKKFLWELKDGKRVESVLIYSFERRTVCLSSQVGCPARCAFCASGKEGLIRSLSTAEIVEQILHINRTLQEVGERVCHLVYMGMGEPLENYDAVMKSLRIAHAPFAFHISQRRITLSTVGVVEGIRRLALEGLHMNLALSLHAPTQHLRKKIIPFARKYPLDEILLAVDHYAASTKRDITFEYTLMAGINDSEEVAKELVTLLAKKQCTVNLIPYNPVIGLRIERPSQEAIVRFCHVLEAGGIRTTQRYTKGDSIGAACGQLALSSSLIE